MVNPYEVAQAFAKDFGQMDYALKRNGYLRKGKEVAEADWDAFAKHLGAAFFEQVVATEIAKTLIGHPPRRLLANLQWSPIDPAPLANVAQLVVNGVCRVRNSYLHGEKFAGGPHGQWERDVTLIAEAHVVLKEMMRFVSLAAKTNI